MNIQNVLLFLSSLSFTNAFQSAVNGFGAIYQEDQILANQHPNASTSVPLKIGSRNFTLRVNVADYTPGINVSTGNTSNPRIAASFYTLEWTGNTTLNSTIATAEAAVNGGYYANTTPIRFCYAMLTGLYSVKVTNGYAASDDGDCTGPLGKECVDALKNTLYAPGVACGTELPRACQALTGSIGSTSLIPQQSNSTPTQNQNSPLSIGWQTSAVHEQSDTTYYERELERLHVFVFSGQATYPVCVRVDSKRVSKKDPGTSGAADNRVNLGVMMVMMMVGAMVWMS